MKYPDNIKTWKQKLVYRFFMEYYTFNLGKQNLFGRWTGPVMEISSVLVLLKVYGWAELTMMQMVSLGVLVAGVCYLGGYFWKHFNLDRMESMVGIERNQFQRAMYKDLIKKSEEFNTGE